jgi:hypothetical protein
MAHKRGLDRRALLGVALVLPLGACAQMSEMSDRFSHIFRDRSTPVVASRGERMARWIQDEGRDAMMAPEALALMGITNQGRDIPAKLIGKDGPDGRYVIVLITIRGRKEFIVHRKQNDVLILHNCDFSFNRLSSVRYPHYGKLSAITDQTFAENDFQQQLAFWFDLMPGR